MLRLALGVAAVCAIHTIGIARRGRPVEAPRGYEFNARQGAGIISPALVGDVLEKTTAHISKEDLLIDSTGVDDPETLQALKVPLQALIDGVVFVRNKRFRSCSDVEALELPDFNMDYLVVDEHAAVVGYFEPAPAGGD